MGQTPNNLKVAYGVGEIVLKKRCFETTSLPLKLPLEPKDPITVSGSMKKQPNCR